MALFKRIKNNPYFPFIPVVPLVIGGALITLEAISLLRLRRLSRRVDALMA
jgi:hypothetical protein